jgi:hypothetical protein
MVVLCEAAFNVDEEPPSLTALIGASSKRQQKRREPEGARREKLPQFYPG